MYQYRCRPKCKGCAWALKGNLPTPALRNPYALPSPPPINRASVVIPLCNVDGVASVLFTKRASTMRAHKNEVCFPGGKV